MTKYHAKLEKLANLEGFDDVDQLFECRALDSCVPAICMTAGCDFTADYEPDQDKGWCEHCDANTVQSALIIAGFI
jgi:hypothetical protein